MGGIDFGFRFWHWLLRMSYERHDKQGGGGDEGEKTRHGRLISVRRA
jgi:hypothetical protein